MSRKQAWQTYEEVAICLLDQMAERFGITLTEGKQKVSGKSGAFWEIDGKAAIGEEGRFFVVECRRYSSDRLKQGRAAELAWIIQDTGAEGGIIVSPLPLQKGAQKVAEAANIWHVRLDANSTRESFILAFGNWWGVGLGGSIHPSGTLEVKVLRAHSLPSSEPDAANTQKPTEASWES